MYAVYIWFWPTLSIVTHLTEGGLMCKHIRAQGHWCDCFGVHCVS